jgi:hypothetical protein
MGLDFEVNNFFHDLWWHKIFEKGPAQYCVLAETLILPLKKEEKRTKVSYLSHMFNLLALVSDTT